jgi:hypothetical protein
MSTVDDLFRQLPELPQETFEAAGTLERSDRGPFVTLRPHKPPAPQEPPQAAHAPSKSSFTERRYFTQAIYPRVICYEPGDLLAGLSMSFDPQPYGDGGRPPTDFVALARQERFYKLSALQSVKFRDPLWCSVKYGPWLAAAKETESCLDGVPNRWEFFIIEMPEVALVWFGEWQDMPAFPSLTVIMGDLAPAGHQTFCCPGFHWCPTTGSCIPQHIDCQDPMPA